MKKAINQLLDIDNFFSGGFAVKGEGIFEDFAGAKNEAETETISRPAETKGTETELSKTEQLEKIAEEVKVCTKCSLSESRTFAVPGEGNPDARIVFVGEGPGGDEDKSGSPFVGRAGQLLTKIINAMKLSREDVFICNVIKCRPPNNRDPLKSEKDACRDYLYRQLAVIEPEIIVALGSHAAQELLQTDTAIGKLRGRFHDFTIKGGTETIKFMPTYHPAYLLRNYSTENRKKVWDDMQLVMQEIGIKS
ncbi:uracil-DNA glycosylase, family 4 [Sedimentisphaera cyanobacteriorum]|uniref:Type-4 uracil-DNA glycosylase n=1 Tax=Sedimentisphaera cyanobacteriorum TaxID=1940790 RepID=A0A1Q2HNS7_9BACT|nr:uracil-DNA glycosylase [Sedimentisphaera cyanobacteriorum]AQQ08914.1 uracil-DNA glycosylase, family 4 [Sedimentisphaera cyanobacteriorum]